MKFLVNSLAALGTATLAVIGYITVINMTDDAGAMAKIAPPVTIPEVDVNKFLGLSLARDVLSATDGAVSISLEVAAPKKESKGIPFTARLSVSNIGPMIDRVLKQRGDLVADKCAKVKWAGPTVITKVTQTHVYVKARVQVSVYKSVFKHCNVKIWGPDHKTVKARIALKYIDDTVSVVVDEVDVVRLGDYFEDKMGLGGVLKKDLLTTMGISDTAPGTTLAFSFEGNGDRLVLVLKGELLNKAPVIVVKHQPRPIRNDLRPYRDKRGVWHQAK